MSSKLTRIRLPGLPNGEGRMEWDEVPVAEMIAMYRRNARRALEAAQAILNAADSEFQIDVVRGSAVQHHVKTLQQSSRKDPK